MPMLLEISGTYIITIAVTIVPFVSRLRSSNLRMQAALALQVNYSFSIRVAMKSCSGFLLVLFWGSDAFAMNDLFRRTLPMSNIVTKDGGDQVVLPASPQFGPVPLPDRRSLPIAIKDGGDKVVLPASPQLLPMPLPAQLPVIVPMTAYFEPVVHDHPPIGKIREIIRRSKKRKFASSWSSSVSDESSDTDTSDSTSTSSSDENTSLDYYDDFFNVKG